MIRRADLWVGCRAGLVGGLAMVATMLAGRLLTGAPALPDVVADAVTWLLPIELTSGVIDALKYGAKPLFFAGLVVGQLAIAVGLGIVYGVYARATAQSGSLWSALGYALGLWVLTMVLILPLAGAGFFGAGLKTGQAGLLATSLAAFVAYGIGLRLAGRTLDAGLYVDAPARDQHRRALVNRGAFVALAVATGGLAWLALPRPAPAGRAAAATVPPTGPAGQAVPPTPADPWAGLTPELTDNDEFYTVSKNFEDPAVNQATWKLEVKGLVERPLSFTYDEFVKLPAREQYATLTCISNEVGGDLVGNALWKGVPLADLLSQAVVKPGVQDVVLRGADDYEDSIPLDKALAPGTIVAFEMNGKTLPRKHGFPVRLVVPGIYGMKNVKWLTGIELVDYDFKGFWQKRGWSDSAAVNTMSRIDEPFDRSRRPGRSLRIGGIAFAGDRGISKVEVSTDNGKTWQEALLKAPLSAYTWVLWRLPWQPPKPGYHRLRVRAYDGTSAIQTAAERDPLPNGATGFHTVQVDLSDEG